MGTAAGVSRASARCGFERRFDVDLAAEQAVDGAFVGDLDVSVSFSSLAAWVSGASQSPATIASI